MGFDPVTAASSAATFAGILAAIVLAVLGQLAITSSRTTAAHAQPSGHQYQYSLLVGFPLLTQLLACAYTFVLLSGESASLPRGTNTSSTNAAIVGSLSSLRGAAFGFAICGSMLAVAALGSIVFLRLVLQETGGATSVAASATVAVVKTGVLVDIVFLVYGYGDIHKAFYKTHFSVAEWLATAATIVVPVAVGMSYPKKAHLDRQEMTDQSAHWGSVRPLSVAAVLISSLLPVCAFLVANKHTFSGEAVYTGASVQWLTYTCAAWSGLLFGFLVWLSRAED